MSILNKKITLKSVVTKIRNKSLQDHDGNIHDHAVDIFSTLTNEEKVVFIEDIVNIFSISESRNQHANSIIRYNKNQQRINTDIERRENFEIDLQQSLEYKNGASLIDIKNFITKCVVIFVLLFLFTAGICIIYLDRGESIPSWLDFISKFYKLLS